MQMLGAFFWRICLFSLIRISASILLVKLKIGGDYMADFNLTCSLNNLPKRIVSLFLFYMFVSQTCALSQWGVSFWIHILFLIIDISVSFE